MDIPVDIIGQLGFAAVFLYLFIKKDGELKDANIKLQELFRESTRTQTELKDAIQENTKASEKATTITNEIFRQLIKRGDL